METENLADESTKFQNLTASNIVMSPGNSTPGGNEVIKLNALNKIGPAKSIRVYPGDKINASAMSYYINQGGFSKTPNATMATILAPVFGGVAGAPGDPGSIFSNVGQAYGNTSTLGLSPNQGTAYPSAFLNFILFDKNYKPLDGKSVPISTEANLPKPLALPEITALEVGYVFIYLSYDNDTGGDVFFDDLKITVQESPVIQVNNYYPFGMQSYTWLREGETDNAYLFQGKELIAQTGWHDFGSRMYYGDLGRWFATDPQKQFSSPYLAMGNIPMMGRDPNGELFGIDDLILGVVGGVANLAINAFQGHLTGNIWEVLGKGAASFGAGFVAGATATYGPAAWAASGALLGATNSWVAGGNGMQILQGAVMGSITSVAGGAIGQALAPVFSPITNGIASPILRGAIGGSIGGTAVGGILGGINASMTGGNFLSGVGQGAFSGLTMGFITGGLASGAKAWVRGFNPLTGNDLPSIRYRAMSAKDAASVANGEGITAKNPDGSWTVEEHLQFGSSKAAKLNDPWISTSSKLELAKAFDSANGMVRIDLKNVNSSYTSFWEYGAQPNRAYWYSKFHYETSILRLVPPSAIKGVLPPPVKINMDY
jgi:RHS repeat-associated protein